MKKYTLLLFVILALVLSSCKGKEDAGNQKIKVSVTILPYSGIVKEIGGDKVEITVLVPPQSACETYEPTPVDIAKAGQSGIYFSVGANYAFEKNLLQGISENHKNVEIVDCSQGIDIKGNNPHVWLYPEGLKKIAEHIYTALKKASPGLDSYFAENKNRFIKQVDSVDAVIKNNLQPLKGKEILVFHPSWLYFAAYYNLEQIAIESEGKEPTALDLKKIVDLAKKKNIKTLFLEPNTNEESAAAIKEELKASSVLLNPMEENVIKNLLDAAKKISGSFQ